MGQGCGRCGAEDEQPHEWTDGDCVLPVHRNHSRRLVDGGHVCIWCVERHRDWLAEIVELFTTLPYVLESLEAGEPEIGTKPSKQPDAPAPCRLEILSLMNPGRINGRIQDGLLPDGRIKWRSALGGDNLPDVPATVGVLAANLHEAMYGVTGTVGDTLAGAAAFLQANIERLACDPEIDTADAELTWVRRHLLAAHGLKDRPAVVVNRKADAPMICPTLIGQFSCGGALIPDTTGELAVHCAKCQRVFQEHELRRLGQMLTYQQEAS
jgi:hypothetical protein